MPQTRLPVTEPAQPRDCRTRELPRYFFPTLWTNTTWLDIYRHKREEHEVCKLSIMSGYFVTLERVPNSDLYRQGALLQGEKSLLAKRATWFQACEDLSMENIEKFVPSHEVQGAIRSTVAAKRAFKYGVSPLLESPLPLCLLNDRFCLPFFSVLKATKEG